MNIRLLALCAAACFVAAIAAQTDVAPLADPLTMADGTKVTSAAQWRNQRRPELLALFTREIFGVAPPRSPKQSFVVFDKGSDALGGKAIRRQVTLLLNGDPKGPRFDLLVYIPKAAKGRVPAILGINFSGNHAITTDPGVRITSNPAESGRGVNAAQWPVEEMLDRGYALATFYRGDVDPDTKDGFDKSLKAFYPELQNRGDNFSTIGEWAWALSRALDYLATDRAIDARRVAAFGWSRLGKAALWAGATDERFAAAISNESGAGGAKLFHRGMGENITRLNTVFPHWYDQNFRKYNERDTTLPFDQHEVIALIAPRAVYIASAVQDANSDPEGEFAAAKAAEPVFLLLGKQGLGVEKWPAVDHPVGGDIAYHVRSGGHDVKAFDWEQYLRFLDKHLRGK